MIIPFRTAARPIALMLMLCSACTSRAQNITAVRAPAASAEPAATAQHRAQLRERVERATRRCEAITSAAALEDAPRQGKIKTRLVREQLRSATELAAKSLPPQPYREGDVSTYEAACAGLERAYLGTLLESTDPPSQLGAWTSDEGRDVLGSPSVDAKLAAWQAKQPERPFVKFAVVRAADGQGLEMRVGPLDVGHVDIAGGPALTAGLLRTAVVDGKTQVVVLENTSGGFRPGPLRNRIALAAIQAAGYLPASSADLTVYDNPTGGYDSSTLMPRKKP
jgi:hypothetical protein